MIGLQPIQVDPFVAESLDVARLEIMANHADQAHRAGEIRGGEGDVGGRPAQNGVFLAEWGFDAIICDGTDSQE